MDHSNVRMHFPGLDLAGFYIEAESKRRGHPAKRLTVIGLQAGNKTGRNADNKSKNTELFR